MAQTKKKRRRKHRGTQGGSIDSGRRAPRPRSRAEARAQVRSQSARRKKQGRGAPAPRRLQAPTWRSAINSAAIGAVIFFVMLILFKQPIGAAIGIAGVMFLVYVPMSYTINRFFFNRRMAKELRERADRGRS